ncbi:succinate dehydrogenase flavoprotein subunit [Legionella quinlivanii]|uniref:Succinate dehydrogenase flavoprotein subunit n=1 Tax=Legionella quinlivanii TaxID=45073 RepID=A0A0W0Y5S8_9GAMM|nr:MULTISPECIES: succinate dehydrogenase flavoprotein subunit [Legionella]KTD52165.1 succinate dehydrogenase flavoprotein subunit [Legionella quinlivanii]MCE3045116.1 succinate dehydrogenase flavoprotein subunit [Legionella sp. 16cNR16C]MCW8452429.1 succinate dehydrogenase flavoprotein subunit [Legionella quinlivanii]RAP36757.1 succinate dehydrogenase flavoprotein subunit [Legionella quinlivanii]SEF76910.1 succinate dehydrogenase subunit A [Legionella quinlivanii DSM 21216]
MALARNKFDAVIIGAGGAGMRAALQLANSGLKVALLSKVFPTRSHTVSAQGGITAALGNADEDDWRWHMYDTVKGADYIGDQDCIEYLCKTGPEAVYELEHMGLPFSRMDNGRIYQRQFGGQSKNFGGEQAARTCAAADRTGHALLHTLYQQNLRAKTHVFSEWYALDLVKDAQGRIAGVTAICIETGEVVFYQTRICILATGGAGRIYQSTTNAYINTGDGFGMALRAGIPLQDMEMWQFHPTGIAGAGTLVTEGCRGEGGYLINKDGERFMERYAPRVKDLASRDVVARAMALEIRAGKGFDPQGVDYVKLKLDHLGADLIKARLPGIRELSIKFAGVDPIVEPIPVVPTCHYSMGGIPTNIHGQVLTHRNGMDQIVEGLYAVGECACVSVHGANRLGGNSLLDLVVFGRAAGLHVEELWQSNQLPDMPYVTDDDVAMSLARYQRWQDAKEGDSPAVLRAEMQRVMQEDFGVFRTGQVMAEGLHRLDALKARLENACIKDKSKVFNTELISALELDNLMATAYATAQSALARTESRGAHSREDFPKRDDANWIKHTLYFGEENLIDYRPVNVKPKYVEPFQPKERVY